MVEIPRGRYVCILGATSAIGEHTARLLAARGDSVALVARSGTRLQAIAADLSSRGAAVVVPHVADLNGLSDPGALIDAVAAGLGGLDAVLMFHGDLGVQSLAETDTAAAIKILDVNFASAATLSLAAAARLEVSSHPRPVLIAIGSVAGDRGRASNFIYGAAKGGLAILYQGLAHRFARRGLAARAVVIKAGFVDTPMTAAFPKGGPLWAAPETIARTVVAAMERGGPVIYAPWFWRWIMLVIRLLPQPIMNKINL
jgi:short-subunit dehydrogenase